MRNKIAVLYIFVLMSISIFAQDIPDPMQPFRLVNDFANVFSSSERQALESKLISYNDTTSTQIYVVTVNDLGGYAASDYAFVLGEKWGIGQSGKDNGLLILIKPKVGSSRGQAFVATGYGLEAYITDAFAGRIVRDYMVPYFQYDDYFGGVNSAVDVVIAKLSGEFDADRSAEDGGLPLWVIIVIFVAIFIVVTSSKGGGDQNIDRGGHHNSGGGPVFFPPVIRGGRSGWGGGSFGGGGFSGGGFGGGFGGGGGGRFGGGGAGGSW